MKEQSHKAEMASALQGDFARLRARGVATTLPAAQPERPATVERDEPPVQPDALEGVEPERGSEPLPSPAPWLHRLLGR